MSEPAVIEVKCDFHVACFIEFQDGGAVKMTVHTGSREGMHEAERTFTSLYEALRGLEQIIADFREVHCGGQN